MTISPTLLVEGGEAGIHTVPGFPGIFPDAAFLKSETLQSAIFNNENLSLIATDEKGVIQLFNVGAERMLGYTASEVVNQMTPAFIADPGEVVAHAEALSLELDAQITPGFQALVFKASRGMQDIYELTNIRKDGTHFPAIVSITALRDAAGGTLGYLLIATDNTARKQAEEALLKAGALQTEMLAKLKVSNKELEEFAYAASHDIKAPLRVIDNCAKWLEEDLEQHLSGETRDNMRMLRHRVGRLDKLLDDLLAYARIGRLSQTEMVAGDILVHDVLEMLAPHPFTVNVSPGFAAIQVPRMPLQQVLMNLIGNAIKHHHKQQGNIEVAVEDTGS